MKRLLAVALAVALLLFAGGVTATPTSPGDLEASATLDILQPQVEQVEATPSTTLERTAATLRDGCPCGSCRSSRHTPQVTTAPEETLGDKPDHPWIWPQPG